VNWQIAGKERLRNSGQIVFLELAPIDPRSLMQGDYMALNFAVARAINPVEDGIAILAVDPRRAGTYARLDNGAQPGPDEMRLRFRIRNGAVWLATNAFFFHEGDSARYRDARFGEFRVNPEGDAMLVGLRDKDLRPM
jgi:uncharacterized membrane-anchored protein